MEAPQNRRFYGKMECLPLWLTYKMGHSFYFILISWRCLTSPIFKNYYHFKFFAMSQFDWPISKISWNYGSSPNNSVLWKDEVPPTLAHPYRREGEDFGQKNGIKMRSCWEHIGNLWNILGTWWELKGICWERRKNEKKSSSPPPPLPKT